MRLSELGPEDIGCSVKFKVPWAKEAILGEVVDLILVPGGVTKSEDDDDEFAVAEHANGYNSVTIRAAWPDGHKGELNLLGSPSYEIVED